MSMHILTDSSEPRSATMTLSAYFVLCSYGLLSVSNTGYCSYHQRKAYAAQVQCFLRALHTSVFLRAL